MWTGLEEEEEDPLIPMLLLLIGLREQVILLEKEELEGEGLILYQIIEKVSPT